VRFSASIAVVLGFGLMGCNPEEPIPAYVHIQEIQLDVRSDEGTADHKIVDAWFYLSGANGGLQGAYELPASFPVLETGEREVLVRAGVQMSGLSTVRIAYPFYDFYVDTVNFTPNGDITLAPRVRYYEGLEFPWMDNFEDPGLSLETTSFSDTTLVRITDDRVFEGNGCMAFFLDTARSFFECATTNLYPLPAGADEYVFLELNYKTNNQFVVGIYAETPSEIRQIESVYVLPKEEWNKMYINLSNQVSQVPDAVGYRIFFGAIKQSDVDTAEVYIDNIKLIY